MNMHELVPLKCPSCGGATTEPSQPQSYGAVFSCQHCGTKSVLIINQALLPVDVLHKAGDQVCAVCGQVAKQDARFCQDGHKLVRTCEKCEKEFAAHHQRCDYCGWSQDIKRGTPEYNEIERNDTTARLERDLDDAIAGLERKLSDSMVPTSWTIDSVSHIMSIIQDTLKTVGSSEKVVLTLLNLLHGTKIRRQEKAQAGYILAGMKGDASGAVPMLLKWINDDSNRAWLFGKYGASPYYCQVLAMIAPQETLPLCRKVIETSGKNPKANQLTQLESALRTTKLIGRLSVPMLLEFCGSFSGERGKLCKAVANEISQKGRLQPSWDGDGDSSDEHLWISHD